MLNQKKKRTKENIISHPLLSRNNLKRQNSSLQNSIEQLDATPAKVSCIRRESFWNRKSKEEHATLATFSFPFDRLLVSSKFPRKFHLNSLLASLFHRSFRLCSPANGSCRGTFSNYTEASRFDACQRWIESFLTKYTNTYTHTHTHPESFSLSNIQ